MRKRRTPWRSDSLLTAMPSMVTRSNGGWSRSAYTFSRSVPPTHCVSGSDSIGRHVRREWMASSARRGVMSVLTCIYEKMRRGVRAALPSLGLLLRLISFQLIVEAAGHRMKLIDGGVVLLSQNLDLAVYFRFIVLRELHPFLRLRRVDLARDAVQIGSHLRVVAADIVLRGDHLLFGRSVAVGDRIGGARVSAVICVGCVAKRQSQRERYPSLHRESSSYRWLRMLIGPLRSYGLKAQCRQHSAPKA